MAILCGGGSGRGVKIIAVRGGRGGADRSSAASAFFVGCSGDACVNF